MCMFLYLFLIIIHYASPPGEAGGCCWAKASPEGSPGSQTSCGGVGVGVVFLLEKPGRPRVSSQSAVPAVPTEGATFGLGDQVYNKCRGAVVIIKKLSSTLLPHKTSEL